MLALAALSAPAALVGPSVYSNSFTTSASIAAFSNYYSVGAPVYGGLEWGSYVSGGLHSNDGFIIPYVQTNRTDWDESRVINDLGIFFDQTNVTVLTDAVVYANVQCRAWSGHMVGVGARMAAPHAFYAAVFGATTANAWRVQLLKRVAGVTSVLAEQNPGTLIAWRNYRVELYCEGSTLIARLHDLYNGAQVAEVSATDTALSGPGQCGLVSRALLDGNPATQHKCPVWDLGVHALLPPPPDTNIYLELQVRHAGSGAPLPAVLEMRYLNSSGAFLPDGKAGWTTPSAVFAFGPPWRQPVGPTPTSVWLRAWHGDEFEYHTSTIAVPAGGTNITITLTPRVDMTALGWWAGGDHNHLGRGGKKAWKHNGGLLSMEYMATVLSAMGYDWWQCGVNGGWEIENAGDPLSANATVTTIMHYPDASLRAACSNFNARYPDSLYLWYCNENLKTRYGHLWTVGQSTAPNGDYPHPNTLPPRSGYGDGYWHNWWAAYDDEFDLWQYGLGSAPADWYWPQYADSGGLQLPPYHETIWALNNARIYSIWAHLTQSYPPIYAKLLPFDLLTGVKFGGVAMIGAEPSSSFQLCLDAYNCGYQFAGFGENDSAYGDAAFPRNYTFIYCPVISKTNFNLNVLMDWGCRSNKTISSSGSLAILDADDGAVTIGDTLAADGAQHTLRLRAWANPKPGNVLANVSLYRNGAVLQSWSPNTIAFETNVVVAESERAYYLLRVNDNEPARFCITSPIYFAPDPQQPLPPIVKASISGGVYDYRGTAIPGVTVDLLYTGVLHATTLADAAGRYRFTNVHADCVLHFHNAAGLDERRSPILHDDAMNDYMLRTVTGQYYYAGGGLGGVLDPHSYAAMAHMISNCTVNVRSRDYVPLATFDDTSWDGWTFSSAFAASLETAKARQGNCVRLVKQNANSWNSFMYARDVTALGNWSNAVGMVVALNGASGWPGANRIWIEFRWRVWNGAVSNEFYRNCQYITTGDHWYDSFIPLNSNLFFGDRIEMWASLLINPGSGGSGAVLYMDELRLIVPKAPALAPTLLAPHDGAFMATNCPLLVWSCDEPSVSNFAVVLNGGPPVDVGTVQYYQVPAPLAESPHTWWVTAHAPAGSASSATNTFTVDITPPSAGSAAFTSPASGVTWYEGATEFPAWTTDGIADAHLDTNAFGLYYAQSPGYALIADPFAGLQGSYPWFIAGVPQTYPATHLKLLIRDKAGNTTAITSPPFTLVDQGDVRTSAWRYVTVYHFDDPSLAGFQNGNRAALSWDTNAPYLGAGCLKGTVTSSSTWMHCFYKPNVSPDANWEQASALRLRAKFPADFGGPGLSHLDMIFFFATNVEHRQTLTLDNTWRMYEFPLNSNFFQTPPVTMDMILQPFGAQPPVGAQFWLDEMEIFTWDEIPEPAACALAALLIALTRRAAHAMTAPGGAAV